MSITVNAGQLSISLLPALLCSIYASAGQKKGVEKTFNCPTCQVIDIDPTRKSILEKIWFHSLKAWNQAHYFYVPWK